VFFSLSESRAGVPAEQVDPVAGRWLLWIDGVGGYLLLPGDDWAIGGPTAAGDSEICIQGDLSRREACLRRQDANYVLQPLGTVMLGGRRMNRPATLRDGDVITLGTGVSDSRTTSNPVYAGQAGRGVNLEFTKPHPLSSSAKLTLDGRHKTCPRSDGVILLADTCILGPNRNCHIATPLADCETVLLFRDGGWFCRGGGEFAVAGKPVSGRVPVPLGAQVQSGGLSFSLEAAG
jgi:hypothetical protein